MSAATINLTKVQSPSECGNIEKLRATITSVSGCLAASQPVTISGSFPSTQFEVVGGDFNVNGSNVTITVTAAQINQSGGKTVELWLRPKLCSPPEAITILLTASANGMALSSTTQPFICDPTGNLTTAALLWNITPQAACISLSKTALNANVNPGEPIEYEVTLTNTGAGTATNLPVIDDYPDELTPTNLPPGATVSGGKINWTSTVPAGGSTTYSLSFNGSSFCGGTFPNCVEATACNTKLGPACATVTADGGAMQVVQITGNMGVIAEPGIPAAGLPSPPGLAPIIVEFASFSTLTVNSSYNFPPGSIFRMHEGASIVVRGGKLLSLQNKTKMGSCDKLWKGFKIENGGSLFMAGVSVEDAQYVVNPVQDAWVWIDNCEFINNYIGLYAPELPFYNINHHLWSNTIRSDKPLKPMYAGQSPAIPQDAWGYAGIWIVSNASPVIVGGSYADPSIFEGLVWGIYVNDFTDLTVFGTQFKNLTRSTYPNFTVGISASTLWGSPIVSVKGLGKNDPKKTFDHCDIGILSNRMQLDKVMDCRMENVAAGIWSFNHDYMRLKVQQNNIKTWVYGMLFQNGPLTNTIYVYDNTIDFHEGTPPLAYNLPQSGIYFFNCRPFNVGPHVGLNIIDARNTEYGGIHSVSSSGMTFSNNTVTLYSPKTRTAGIYIEGGERHFLTHNHCSDPATSLSAGPRVSGIYASMHYLLDWCCNDVHGTRNGIFIDGDCTYEKAFWGNSFDNHVNGLRFGTSGVIGIQTDNQGNLWPAGSGGVFEALHEGGPGGAFFSPFAVEQADPYEPNPVSPFNIGTGKWFADGGENPFECPGGLICSNVQTHPIDPKDIRVAEGIFSMPYHSAGSLWTARRDLYARLVQEPELMPSGSVQANYFAAQQYAEIGRLASITQSADALRLLSASDAATAENYYNTAQGLITQIAALDVQLSTASEAQQPGLQAQKDTLLQQYQNNHAAQESFWTPLQQQALNNADQLLAQTEALATTTLQGANEKIWRRIYLAKLFRGDLNLTSQQIADLQAVAAQCPLDGGNVVYAARGALEMIQGSPITWPDNCGDGLQGAGDEREEMAAPITDYKCFPNPFYSVITVEFPLSEDADRKVEVVNCLGQVVSQTSLATGQITLSIEAERLNKGVYCLIVRKKDLIVYLEKVVKL